METIIMSEKESKRIPIIMQVENKQISQREAGELIGLSRRQIIRCVKRVKQFGIKGLCHKNRDRVSNRKTPEEIVKRILILYKKHYHDFGPTLAQEKLAQRDKVLISRETLRKILIDHELWKVRSKKNKPLHIWRQRRSNEGELVQIDGSHHRWLENRLDQEFCLMAYIDDATNKVYARFYEYEGVHPALDSFQRFIAQYGKPRQVYIDRHSTYKTTKKASIDETLEGGGPLTQFQRVMKELNIDVIFAQSPQAKGRIERLFKTFQDRLVKEMRLANIFSIEAANKFLETYLPIYNHQFCFEPQNTVKLWRPLELSLDNKWTFAMRVKRTILKDYTIRCFNRLFLIQNPYLALRGQKVEIRFALDGGFRFTIKHKVLNVREITALECKSKKESLSHSLKKLRQFTTTHTKSKKSWMDGFYFGKQYKQIIPNQKSTLTHV